MDDTWTPSSLPEFELKPNDHIHSPNTLEVHDELPNCSYRYDYDVVNADYFIALYLDGPLTLLFAAFALLGTRLAVKFLAQARLNRDLTSALYVLCFCDAFLIVMVVIYHSIEATGLLVLNRNTMWNHQATVVLTHGLVSAATTASTLLVVYITFQRFLVVWWPLKYANIRDRQKRNDTYRSSTFRKISTNEDPDSIVSTTRRQNSVPKLWRRKTVPSFKNVIRPFIFPVFVVVISFLLNSTVFFEFELTECYAAEHATIATQFFPTELRQSQTYHTLRTIIFMATQTVGPISFISFLTVITEYKVNASLKSRRLLFESQQRRRSVVMLQELKEKLSRFVAIFIAMKFIILRSLPVFFDLYELACGIECFGTILSILVRFSDFAVVLNSATNSLAYVRPFRLESKLRGRIIRRSQLQNTINDSPSTVQSKKSILLTTSEQTSVAAQLMGEKNVQ
ncbi:G-PROTEIN-RECEP-F1-2 domain-containing protein [Aphelenchoides besseyi]|nr:G-PROTEIN-RECEP-F1-2 domain-containing protein [Aphelenchoides besseyi]